MNDSDFGLAGIDTTIVLLYLAGVLGIGTYFGRFVKNAGDFFIAGKALPFWAVGMSIVVSDIGATDFIAVAGGTYIFCLPGSPGAWKDAWDDILVHQLDIRYRPCNFVEMMPRLKE